MENNFFLWAKRLLPLIGIVIFVVLVLHLGFEDISDALLSVSPFYVFAAAVPIVPAMLIRAYAWQLVLREQHISLGFFRVAKILFIGYFYGMITPGYVGQIARVVYVKEETQEPSGKLFVNVFIEMLLRTFSLYLVLVVGAFALLSYFPHLVPLTVLWVGVIVLFSLVFVNPRRGSFVFEWLIVHFVPCRMQGSLSRFVDSFYQDFPRIRVLLVPFVLGLLSWWLIFSLEYLFVIALDLSIPYLSFLLLFPIANVAGFIPISFGGLGTRELTAVIIFSTLFSVSESAVFVVSILGFLITDIYVGLIGFALSLTETRVPIPHGRR